MSENDNSRTGSGNNGGNPLSGFGFPSMGSGPASNNAGNVNNSTSNSGTSNGNINRPGNANNSNNNNQNQQPRVFTFTTGGPVNGIDQNGGPLGAFFRNMMAVIQAGAPPEKKKRHFTKEALKQLNPVRLSELPDNDVDRRCSICFEPFEEYEPEKHLDTSSGHSDSSEAGVENVSGKSVKLPEMMSGYQVEDPPIEFPTDPTAVREHSYTVTDEEYVKKQIEKEKESVHAQKTDENAHYAVKLPQCEHVFGRSCIVEWLKSNISCPLCRREVVPEMSEENNTGNGELLVFYPVALTEVFVPIDWTGPRSTGYRSGDPPVNFPAEGEGSSTGRVAGPPPPDGNGNASNNSGNNNMAHQNEPSAAQPGFQ